MAGFAMPAVLTRAKKRVSVHTVTYRTGKSVSTVNSGGSRRELVSRILPKSRAGKLGRKLARSSISSFWQRRKLYAPLLREKRLKGLVYLVERKGLGPEFARIGDFKTLVPNLKKLFSVKKASAPFLDALLYSGGANMGKVLQGIDGLELGKALTAGLDAKDRNSRGFGSSIGHALKVGGAKDFCDAIEKAGGLNLGQGIVYGHSGNFGNVLKIASGSRVGEALRTAGGMAFAKAVRASDSSRLGNDLAKSFRLTVMRIKNGTYR